MGRAKLNMELITKEKSRNVTFKKRKEGLIRKMHEFTTLCDVGACMIIYGPKQDKGSVEPEIWPQNPEEVKRIIEIYKSKGKDSSNKTFGLSDFFHDRKRKAEEELAKLKKRNMEAKYPTWNECMNDLDESELRGFAASLRKKAEIVKGRIDTLKRSREGRIMELASMEASHARGFYSHSPGGLIQRGFDHLEVANPVEMTPLPLHYPAGVLDAPNNSMLMWLMNENEHCMGFGGGSSSGNIQRAASYTRQVFYESPAGGRAVMDPVPLARYYPQPVQVAPPPYMVVPGMMPPQLQFSATSRESQYDHQDDIHQFHMKNSIPRAR